MPTDTDREVLAKTIYAEARGESERGQIGVASVIVNRANANRAYWGGASVADVCRHPNMFECWNGRRDIAIDDPAAYARCRQLASDVLDGRHADPSADPTTTTIPTRRDIPAGLATATGRSRSETTSSTNPNDFRKK